MRLGPARWIFLALAAGTLLAPAARAQADLAFTARGVAVDQTAQSATQAREAAIAAGQRTALRQVFERVTPRSEIRRLPQVSAQRLTDLVASFEVEDERVSPTRYLGRLTVRFKPEEVRTLLRNADIPIAETFAKPLVVLPVLQVGNAPVLWENSNPWRAAWAALPQSDGLTPLIAPLGDLEDAASISVGEALAGSAASVAKIAQRYDAAGALVVVAKLAGTAPSQPLKVELMRIGVEGGALPGLDGFPRRAREEDAAFYRRAAVAVAEQIEESWKSDVMLQFGREARLVAVVPVQGLRQWVALRTQLATVAAIRKSDLLSIGHAEAVIEITFIGDENQLRLALAQRNLQLAEEGGRWRLQATGAQ